MAFVCSPFHLMEKKQGTVWRGGPHSLALKPWTLSLRMWYWKVKTKALTWSGAEVKPQELKIRSSSLLPLCSFSVTDPSMYPDWELCFSPLDISPIFNQLPCPIAFTSFICLLFSLQPNPQSMPTLFLTCITMMSPSGLLSSISLYPSLPPPPYQFFSRTHTQPTFSNHWCS